MSNVGGAPVGGAIVAGRPTRGRQVQAGAEPTDDLAPLSDDFGGSGLSSRWTTYNGGGTASSSVSGGELNLTCDQGGAGSSFWFDANQGILVHQLITGNFNAVATVRVRNSADSGLPTVGDGNYRIAGICAHDPNRAVNLNYVHVGLGCTASAGITCEWKTTINSVSTFGAIAAATGVGQIRLDRHGQQFNVYYRPTVDASWTLAQGLGRSGSPLPLTLQVGFMVYASVAAHDIRLFVDRFEINRA